jgi:hypothetical protein
MRPLVYSLGLNNPPRICLTPRKSHVKNLWCNKQGHCRRKMTGTGIQSFAKFRAQMCTAECQGLKTVTRFVAFRWKFKSGTVQSVAFRGQILPRSWHSTVLYIGKWWLAFCSMFESGLPRCYSCCGNPRHLTVELGKWLNSSTHHFTWRVPLFEALFLFAARLLEYKIPTRRIV